MPDERVLPDLRSWLAERQVVIASATKTGLAGLAAGLGSVPARAISLGGQLKNHPAASLELQGLMKPAEGSVGQAQTMSRNAEQAIREVIRSIFSRARVCDDLGHLAEEVNARCRGWYAYYGCFTPSIVYHRIGYYLNGRIVNWARKKYRRFKECPRKAWRWFNRLYRLVPTLFWHWRSPTMA